MHAANVRETLARLMEACKATTPAERRQWAGCIAGIIHLRVERKLTLPAVWKGTASAINSLVSVGLSSVAPNHTYQYGRHRYIQEFLGHLAKVSKYEGLLRELSMNLDLEELQQQ